MKQQRNVTGGIIIVLTVLLLCGCQRVSTPQDELLPAGRPVEGVPADPQPNETPNAPLEDLSPKPHVLEDGLCALLPKENGGYVLYNSYGEAVAQIPAENPGLAGVYPCAAIVAGYRLTEGSAVLPNLSADAQWVQDDAGFTVWDRATGLVYRLDDVGKLQFFCNAPADATLVSLLPLGRDFLFSAWWGDGSAEHPWQAAVAGLVLDVEGKTKLDLTSWLHCPVAGVLGGELLLVAADSKSTLAAYTLQGECLEHDLRLLEESDAQPALGGAVCQFVWKDGWIYSAGLQPQTACTDPSSVILCGDYLSGIQYEIDGVLSNGELLLCDGDVAVWGRQQDVLAIQWKGINYCFPAGTRTYQRLQRCGERLAVAYAWDDDGSGCLRLLFLETGSILEYNCPVGSTVSAALGKDCAVFAITQAGADDAVGSTAFGVVDAAGALRYQGTLPVHPCASGAYLLIQTPEGVAIGNLDGTVLISQ